MQQQTALAIRSVIPAIEKRRLKRPSDPSGWLAEPRKVLPVTDQLIKFPVLLCDLGQHPLAQHGEQALQIYPLKQVEEGGVGGCAAKLKTESRIEGHAVPAGKSLQIPGAATATQDSQDGQQQQQPLGIAHPTTLAALRKRLQKADQIRRRRGLEQERGAIQPRTAAPARHRNRPCD